MYAYYMYIVYMYIHKGYTPVIMDDNLTSHAGAVTV